jgi:hypothetical protein
LIAFQERYDLSVRLEWDPLLDAPNGRWKIVANTLGDLTKRENRYEHHYFRPVAFASKPVGREFPYAAISTGSSYGGNNVAFVTDPEAQVGRVAPAASATANLRNDPTLGIIALVENYSIAPGNIDPVSGPKYLVRPFVDVNDDSLTIATARAMLNDDGQVVGVVKGLVPLSGDRRGEDVMLTDALGFDLRVYDPGAFLYGVREDPSDSSSPLSVVLEPTDPAWVHAYRADMPNMASFVDGSTSYPLVGQGAYVDLGYGFGQFSPQFVSATAMAAPWFFAARALSDVYGNQLAPGYAVFDTWSFHYENDGVNEDHDEIEAGNWQLDNNNGAGIPQIDEGTNGLDDPGQYVNSSPPPLTVTDTRLGPDDVGERETAPPYDKPLRGVQVLLRLYERDSRQIRQVGVNQSFVPE